MAKKKEANEQAAVSPLVGAAKTIGEAAGTVVAAVGGVVGKTSGKLAPKNKARLPRKAKKKAHAEHSRKKALKRKQGRAA